MNVDVSDYRLPDTATRSHFMAAERLNVIWWSNVSTRQTFMWSSYRRREPALVHFAQWWHFSAPLDVTSLTLIAAQAACQQHINRSSLVLGRQPPTDRALCLRCFPGPPAVPWWGGA